jgi:hypothetical protein
MLRLPKNKVWAGTHAAFDQIHGSWENNFQMMYNFKCELEKICPGSIVEIEDKVRYDSAGHLWHLSHA